MDRLLENLEQTIAGRGLFRRGQKILLAVSGGVDSMVLLHLLRELAGKNSWRITVAHLNHQLRGRSSDADERLVVRTAKKMALPVCVQRTDVQKIARNEKISIEMAARQARHLFLARTAERLKIRTVALAHHADDQLELFFLRLLRGSGGEGLAGMKWRNLSPENPKIELVRPLLSQTKTTLLEFAAAKKIAFREDASNASLDIQRNRIRHELIPLLRRHYQPALDRTIARVTEIVAAESEAITAAAASWLRDGSVAFDRLPVAVQRRCLQIQLREKKVSADFEMVERLRLNPNQIIMFAAGLSVARDRQGRLEIAEQKTPVLNSAQVEVDLSGNSGKILFGGVQFSWRKLSGKAGSPARTAPGTEFFDAAGVGSRVFLRFWRPGDRFQPIGMSLAVKLQNLFTNQKIPRADRHRLVLAATVSGELFWVENLRISERHKLSATTNHRLQWCWKRL